ncbi:MAG TPA: SpvB/TcaC N-terminal domain-containing protein, partial [Burkholderiaceae bacterium]|nr:SpvB/TcaC N-terminal domain-containing protein [Burkholderiaceae bacterium]
MPVFAKRLLFAWVIGLAVSQAHAGAPMTTPSSFSVTPQGAAAYQIPIKVAPGVAGVEPKLSFAYNSQGGNGIMGVGWSLSGLSSIMRCPQTIAQDATHGRVSFAATDRFCLDGKRLKIFDPHNAGLPYWAAGAANEYRTEIASFTRVVANGTAGLSGPAWFQVWTKSGEIIEYGNTPDSQITGNGYFTPVIWAVNKVSDRYGNNITFSYKQTNGILEFYPTAINYTANANTGQASNQRVLFNYENRPGTDVIRGYGPGGIPVLTGQELLSVQVLAGTNSSAGPLLVRQYNLTYTTSTASGRSLLQSINECSPATPTVYLPPPAVQGGLCRPLLGFTWPSGSGMLTPDGPNNGGVVGGWAPTRSSDYVADINGDGKSDLIRLTFDGTTTDPAYAQVALSTGTSFNVVSNNTVGPWGVVYNQSGSGCPPIGGCSVVNGFVNVFGDVNGDGKADLVRIHNTTTQYNAQLMLSNGTGFNAATYNGLISPYGVFADAVPTYYDTTQGGGVGYSYQQTSVTFAPLLEDISGDGRADLVLVGMSATSPGASAVVTALATGTGNSGTFATPTTAVTGASSNAYEPGEVV